MILRRVFLRRMVPTSIRALKNGRMIISISRIANVARGVGGIFMDDHCTGDWAADFALTQDIGRAFLAAFVPLIEKRQSQPWSDADREAQLLHRGLYAEYNLVYDRGTKFGLATGHDPDAVLMSLPPLAKWR